MADERKISKSTYMQALGLYTMASRRFVDVEAFHEELCKLLGVDKNSHVGDAIYSGAAGNFDEALAKEGVVVEDSE